MSDRTYKLYYFAAYYQSSIGSSQFCDPCDRLPGLFHRHMEGFFWAMLHTISFTNVPNQKMNRSQKRDIFKILMRFRHLRDSNFKTFPGGIPIGVQPPLQNVLHGPLQVADLQLLVVQHSFGFLVFSNAM